LTHKMPSSLCFVVTIRMSSIVAHIEALIIGWSIKSRSEKRVRYL
jgi:hypothetical protein